MVSDDHLRSLPDVDVRQTRALIDGKWVEGSDRLVTRNPATEEPICEVTNCGSEEVDLAVAAARQAFDDGPWSKLGGYERGILMNRLAELVEKNREELAMLEVLDNGKTIGEARGADLALTIQTYRYYAGLADKIAGTVVSPSGPFAKGMFGTVEKEPVGVRNMP